MKKIIPFLLSILILNAMAQKGVVIPTTPVVPPKSPSVNKPKVPATTPKPSAGTEIWKVDAATTPCISGQCMLVKKAGQKEFEIFEDVIEGFEFTEGNTYTLQVRQTLKQPPIQANESIYKYELVKVISSSDAKYNNTPVPTPVSSVNAGVIVQLEIDYETIACESGSEKQCFLVKEKGRKEYEIFNGCIYGFTYEAGNRYVLQARKNGDDYDFVKVIKKEFVAYNPTKISCVNQRNQYSESTPVSTIGIKNVPSTSIPTTSPLDKKWYLRKMKESEGSSFTTDDNVLWIEINTFNDKLKGFGSCNNFEAVVRTDLTTSFQISKLTSGYVNCGYKKIEDLFYSVLQQADRFEIRNGNLILSKQWKYLMELTSDPNQKEETISSTNYQPAPLSTNTAQVTPPQPIPAPADKNNSTVVNTSGASTIDNKEVDELQKQVEELKRQLEAKKQADAAEAQKKQEQEKLAQLQKEAELEKKQLAEKQKQEELIKQKKEEEQLQKQKELEQLRKQIAQLESETKESNTVSTKNTNKPSTITKSTEVVQSGMSSPKNSPQQGIVNFTKNDNIVNSGPKSKGIVYYEKNSQLISTEMAEATFRGNDKNTFLEISTLESPLQFPKNKLPKFVIRLDADISPEQYISLYSCEFKKDKRQINVRPKKNTVGISFKEIAPNVYEIILPNKLELGEYAFVTDANTNNFNNIQYNTTTTTISCFGAGEADYNQSNNEYSNNSLPSKNQGTTKKLNVSKINIEEPEFTYDMVYIDNNGDARKIEKKIPFVETKSSAAKIITGIGSRKTTVRVDGPTSNFRVSADQSPFIFIVKVDNNSTDPMSVIQVLKLTSTKSERKCETGSIDAFGGVKQGDLDYIEYSAKKYKDSSYLISIDSLQPGEYAINISIPSCKTINLFGVDE